MRDVTPFSTSDWRSLNDGETGGVNENSEGTIDLDGSYTSVFTLDTSIAPDGYAITEIITIAAFNSDRANQMYTLYYRTVSGGSYVLLGTYTNDYTGTGASRITLTDDAGIVADGVDAIKVAWGTAPARNAPLYREIDIFGHVSGLTQVNEDSPSQAAFTASSDDLINAGRDSFESLVMTDYSADYGADPDGDVLNDGAIGGDNDTPASVVDEDGDYSSLFTLNTNGAPGSLALGYTVTQIVTIAAFNAPRAHQKVTLYYSTLDSAGFVPLGTYRHLFYDPGASRITLTADWGAIGSRVDAIKVDWGTDGGNAPLYREIDVFGEPMWSTSLQGPDAGDDVAVIGSVPAMNFGADVVLDVGAQGPRRTLLRFDLSGFAKGLDVAEATLRLSVGLDAPGTYTDATIDIYAIDSADAGWEELQAVWNYKLLGTTRPWSGGPGLGSPATFGTHVGSFTASSSDPVGTRYRIDFADLSFLQHWVNDPDSNGGFLLYSAALEAGGAPLLRLASSQNATAENQPLLDLTFWIPNPDSIIVIR